MAEEEQFKQGGVFEARNKEAKKRRAKQNKKILLYYHCKPLQQLGVRSEAAEKNGSKGFLPKERKGDLNEEEMGLILRDMEGHSNLVKTLERKISKLEKTIALMEENKIRQRKTDSSHLVVSIEVAATPSDKEGPSARETELKSELDSALARNKKLKQRLVDTENTQLALRRRISELEKQTKDLQSKFDREANEHWDCFRLFKKDFKENPMLAWDFAKQFEYHLRHNMQ